MSHDRGGQWKPLFPAMNHQLVTSALGHKSWWGNDFLMVPTAGEDTCREQQLELRTEGSSKESPVYVKSSLNSSKRCPGDELTNWEMAKRESQSLTFLLSAAVLGTHQSSPKLCLLPSLTLIHQWQLPFGSITSAPRSPQSRFWGAGTQPSLLTTAILTPIKVQCTLTSNVFCVCF